MVPQSSSTGERERTDSSPDTTSATAGRWRRFAAHRLSVLPIFGGTLLLVFTFTRVLLLMQARSQIDWNPGALLLTFLLGLLYDLITITFLCVPPALYLALVPERLFHRRWHQWFLAGVGFLLLWAAFFNGAAEWFFWEEFSSRFNFIAVDYLVYTNEVVGNVVESYPLVVILPGITLAGVLLAWSLVRIGWYGSWKSGSTPATSRWRWAAIPLVLSAITFAVPCGYRDTVSVLHNRYNRELAGNGPYCFVVAFQANSLDYNHFYPTMPKKEAFARLRTKLEGPNATFVSNDVLDITRHVHHDAEEHHWNVIEITVESLSARYLGVFGNRRNITPNLDKLAEKSIFFTHHMASGTRTVRGMEALTLSLPPTPGRSIVKRPGNANMFSTGRLFRQRGYDVRFLYGGYGYFDNMNAFFSSNGFEITDLASSHKQPVRFANIWGACDQDLFSWVIDAADEAWEEGKPFYHFVMTTSNHRPYTFPEGVIDAPQKHRASAVQYTDFAIAELLENASRKPWFPHTVFVIVADHCASSAGRNELNVGKYHIPLFIYAPALLPPRRVDALCGQIDVAPTLLGLLNWTYDSRFYGHDVLANIDRPGRAFISNYHDLGYLTANTLTILEPNRGVAAFSYDSRTYAMTETEESESLLQDAIAYYQTAYDLFQRHLNNGRTTPPAGNSPNEASPTCSRFPAGSGGYAGRVRAKLP